MRPVAGRVIRPLIEIPRSEIVTYLEGQHQPWRHDESNDDLGFARNRMRHVVLPTLAAEFNRRLPKTLTGPPTSWKRKINGLNESPTIGWPTGSWEGTEFLIDIGHLPDELGFVRRILPGRARGQLAAMSGRSRTWVSGTWRACAPDRSRKERSRHRASGWNPGGTELRKAGVRSGGVRTSRLRVRIADSGTRRHSRNWHDDRRTDSHPDDVQPNQNGRLSMVESLGPCVKIRNWRNGDFYNPVGLPASKLKRLFQKGRIPRRQRHQWPVLVAPSSSIVWVASFPVSRDFVPTGRSHRIIALEAGPRRDDVRAGPGNVCRKAVSKDTGLRPTRISDGFGPGGFIEFDSETILFWVALLLTAVLLYQVVQRLRRPRHRI